MPTISTASLIQTINLGAQSNDGTGDAIRDAFSKVNQNFSTIAGVLGVGSGLYFTKLIDTPHILSPNKVMTTDASGLTLTQVSLVGLGGIKVTLDQTAKTLTVNSTITNLVKDPQPILAANLSANYVFRGTNFADPVDDQDLATKKWIYDNFLNRDSNYQYISSTNPLTGANFTTTNVEGSTLRHNIQLVPGQANTSTNTGKTITIYNSTGTTSTVDISRGQWLPSHLTRKDYVDTKISLQGISTVDPFTGQVNAGFGQMTGALQLFRDPVETDPGSTAATKAYVDQNSPLSKINFYVSLAGNDARYEVPAYKRGRSLAYAFRTINQAAQAAIQSQAVSEIKLGPYQRFITTNNYQNNVQISSTGTSLIPNAIKLNVNYVGGLGTDPFVERSIRPGMYIQGADSNAMADILNISLTQSSNVEEYYEVQYVDYAETFNSAITADKLSGDVTFTLINYNIVPIPDFWVGYKFQLDQVVGGQSGTIISVSNQFNVNGNVYDVFTVRMDTPLTNLNTISGSNWHVYSGYFITGENLRYGQRYNKLEISLIVESGEYNEQFPIRMADNVSLRGDEFRRTIFKPAYVNGTARASISTSPWVNIWFRRDTQTDGLITCSINTATDYAQSLQAVGATPASVGNDLVTGVTTFTLSTSSQTTVPTSWIKKVFAQYNPDGKTYAAIGTITSVNQNTFYVNLAENYNNQRTIGSTATIASGSWHVFDPINFGYHYLRDPSKPANYIANTNTGGFVHAYNIIQGNLEFLKAEIFGYINQKYSGQFVLDANNYKNRISVILNALAYDLKFGDINQSINVADLYVNDPVTKLPSNMTALVVDMFGYVNTILQKVLINQAPTTAYSAFTQTFFTYSAESVSLFTVPDLTSAMQAIVNQDSRFNPAKYNDQLDVFLMNDATILRYCGGQGHGGFMKVLDPEGQIKSKSPYTQTCSSFSRSTGHHTFAGGMLVDGFCGNLPLTVTTPTQAARADTQGNLIFIPVSGLVRKPQFPCFFIDNGISYEVDYMKSYDSLNGTATLALNSNNAGGVQSVTIQNGAQEFQPNRTSQNPIYCTFINPGVAGAITAKGFVTTDANGQINGFNVTYPGKGYSVQPTIIVGQATFNFTIGANGAITQMSINNGGSGYTTTTKVNISAPGGSGYTATAVITSVDVNGAITGINLTYGGQGYGLSVTPTVTFGLHSFSSVLKNGFVGPLPYNIELNTAGNRSMLANDYTQINDLGYGVFATNGGLIENVSMFTYYNWTSYYALNGAQVRSITGSSCYGFYGLVSEGSNPLEIPTPVTMPDQLTQVATVYNQAPYQNAAGGSEIYVSIDSTYGYAPYAGSEVEVNHYGIRKIYNIQNASLVVGNVWVLSINTTAIGGLYSIIPDGSPVTIRMQTQFRLYGLNATAITRPSTVLTLDEEPTYIYRILNYINLGSDYVLAESEEAYDYINVTPFTLNGNFRQGIGRPSFVSTGSGYTTTASWTATVATPTIKTAVVLGNQGTAQAGVSQLNIGSASGNIHPGMTITGSGVLSGQKVLWVSTDTTVIQTSLSQYWTASTTLSFIGSTATAYAISDQAKGSITKLVITDPGCGYDTAPTVTIWPSPVGISGNASVSVSLSGMIGTNVIKTANIKSSDIARLTTGLTASTPYYYIFGFEGQMYKITKYVPPGTRSGFSDTSVTGGSWGEIEFTAIQNFTSAALTRELWYSSTQPLYAGIQKNQGGSVTIQISTMRATGHDMLNVGTGGYASSKYPNDLYGPPTYLPDAGKITREIGKGRVYSVTTDQDGNFRVGKYFSVDQGRGTVTINAPIALSGISKLSFKKGVEVDNFSIDETMAGNSPRTVPTESAIVGYVSRRLGFDVAGLRTANLGVTAIASNGVIPMGAPLNMATHQINNLLLPSASSDAATKGYTDRKISLQGTNETNIDAGGQQAGVMRGPLVLAGDPKIVIHTLTNSVSANDGLLYLDDNSGIIPGMMVNYINQGGSYGLLGGTTVTNVSTLTNTVSISPSAIGTIAPSTALYFDSVNQAANKRYVDSQAQISKLRDVALSVPADGDLLMFGTPVAATTSSINPVYNSTRQVVNVANSGSVITNTSQQRGGGSDITVSRQGNYATFKIVGGQGSTNPITDYHVNSNAAIQQSKLSLQDAKALYSTAPGSFNQSILGVAAFNSTQFSASNGWISINLTSDLSVQNVIPQTDGSFNLGSSNANFGAVYANTLYGAVDAGQIGGTLPINHGGTNAGTAAGALTNILAGATNQPSTGFVLKASGTGQYFWGQELGGGLQTGTKILTQRLGTTVSSAGQTVFTAPTYSIGSSQLRVYINGVRQSADSAKSGGADYNETSQTTFTINAGLNVGDYVLAEVDGYYFFQVNANSVAYTASPPLTANNVQDAIDQLNANKYEKSGGTISGDVTINTGYGLNLAAGTSAKPALKLISGAILTNAVAGAIEFDGANLYFTQTTGPTRQTIATQTYVNNQGFLKYANNIKSADTSTYSTYAYTAQIAGTSTYAAFVPWNGITGTPPAVSTFSNDAAYLQYSGTITNAVIAQTANALNSANSYQVTRLGVGQALSSAFLTVAAGSISQAAIQLNNGSTLTNAVVGAIEWDGNNLYITSQGPLRQTMAYQSWVIAQGYQTASGNVQQANQATTATYVVNGVYTTGSYPNPTWIPSYDVSKVTNGVSTIIQYSNPSFISTLDAGKLTGTIPSAVLGNSTVYIGTTGVTLNRSSGNLDLAGITTLQMPGSSSGGITLTPAAVAGSNTLTLPAKTATLAVLGDTFYIGTTSVANNRSSANLGLTGISSIAFPGSTSGTAILQASSTAGTPTVTLPTASGTLDLVGATFYVGTTAITNNRSSANLALTGITSIDGTAANVANALTFKNDGTGDAADSTYNGGATRKISYNSIGAAASNQTMYLGTTAVAINRASATGHTLNGVSIDGNAGTVSNGVYTTGSYANPSWITNINYSILNGTIPTWNQDTTGTASKANQLLGQDGSQRSAVYNAATAYSITQRDSSGNITAGTFNGNLSGNATTANYADLAEKYTTDVEYAPGTVVMVGGDEEVTAVTGPDCWVLGVISTNPAHLMNAAANGQPIALTGRVPVKLNVAVKKGDAIYPDIDGGATTVSNGRHPFGFALTTSGPGLVECAIK